MERFVNLLVVLASWAFVLFPGARAQGDIVNGSPASWHDWPFIVSLQWQSGAHNCGGTILNSNTVLTAAHCTYGTAATNIFARAGTNFSDHGGTTWQFSQNHVHPYYNSSNFDHDFAVLKTNFNIFSNPNLQLKYLPENYNGIAAGLPVMVAGWGAQVIKGAQSEILKQTVLQVEAQKLCQEKWSPVKITPAMFCATSQNFQKGTSTCNGDSGGPIIDHTGRHIIGVVSFGSGQGCFATPTPVVFGNIYYVDQWIRQYL